MSHQELIDTDYLYRSTDALVRSAKDEGDEQHAVALADALATRAETLGAIPSDFPYELPEPVAATDSTEPHDGEKITIQMKDGSYEEAIWADDGGKLHLEALFEDKPHEGDTIVVLRTDGTTYESLYTEHEGALVVAQEAPPAPTIITPAAGDTVLVVRGDQTTYETHYVETPEGIAVQQEEQEEPQVDPAPPTEETQTPDADSQSEEPTNP